MTSSQTHASRAGRPVRPISPPKISDRSPFADEEEGVGLGQMVNKLRDVLGFRSSNSAAPPGASGGSSTANTGGLKPPDVTAPGSTFSGDTSEADSKGFPARLTISDEAGSALGRGRPPELTSAPVRVASTRLVSSAVPPSIDSSLRTLPRLITPSGGRGGAFDELAGHATSPLRTTIETSTSPISSHSGSNSFKAASLTVDDSSRLRPTPVQHNLSSQSSHLAQAGSSARAMPSLSARFMQPSTAAPVTSIESASGRATFSAIDSPQASPQLQARSRHTSTGSFSGALGSKVPPFMRPRRGSNASIISSTFRNSLVGSPSFGGSGAFPWTSDPCFTSVPGFPLNGPAADSDNRSIRTAVSVKRNKSASKAIRRLVQGDVLSKDYWMDDDTATACYDCGRKFTTFTRKHHCRICGSIFCGRCASNLLRASRFGAEGTIRVCNLCLGNLEEESDDDDLHSLGSSHHPSAPLMQLEGPHALHRSISQHHHHGFQHHLHHQLHSPTMSVSPRTTFNGGLPTPGSNDLYSEAAYASRPLTPDERFEAFLGGPDDDSQFGPRSPPMVGLEDQAPLRPAPFRTTIAADDELDAPPQVPSETTSGAMAAWTGEDLQSNRFATGSQRPDLTGSVRPTLGGTQPQSYISFPTTDGGDGEPGPYTPYPSSVSTSRLPRSESRARFDSNAPIPSPLAGLRQQSRYGNPNARLDDLMRLDSPGGRPRASSASEPSHAIAGHSLTHFRRILNEAIARVGLEDGVQWSGTLEKLLIKVSEAVQPNVKAGDDMDLRTYVKLKKVPGGRIQDSEFLDGVAITKNVAHKRMVPNRVLNNPRIMVLTLPLEYHRVEGQYVALTPVMAQERDYLRGLVQRIAAQRPHIVLASSPVSRIALEGLLAANIAVARSVKATALGAIMRSTQAEDISSMDRLALEPKLGRCTTLRLTTFDHELIPSRRKTLMRFEGCHKEFGCTLVLRGGDLATLRKVKEVADFMVYAVYHLKLEMFLWHDAFSTAPPEPPRLTLPDLPDIAIRSEYLTDIDAAPETASPGKDASLKQRPPSAATVANRKRLHDERALSRRIYDTLRPYHEVTISISTSVTIPPPFPLAKMSRLDNTLHLLREARYEDEARHILREEQKAVLLAKNAVGGRSDETAPASASVASQSASLLFDVAPPASGLFSPSDSSQAGESGPFDTPPAVARPMTGRAGPLMPLPSLDSMLHSPKDVAQISALAQIESEHATQALLWEWYQTKYTHSLLPQDNQGIFYLAAEGCGEYGHCTPPRLKEVVYYQDDDQTLGQWIDQKADSAFQPCACGKLKVEHYELFTHAETRLQIAMERCPMPVEEGKIMTWTYCLLCETIYSKAFLSEQAWKLSFGKYLETSFYPNPDRIPLPGCPHDFVRSHVRYFIRRNVTIRIHNEAIENFEVILPSSRPYVRAETKLQLKNAEITACFQASNVYFDSVVRKLNVLDGGVTDPTRLGDLRLKLATLLDELEAERRAFLLHLAKSARESSPMDVLAINPVLNQLQEIVVRWDDKLAELEKSFFPTEKDVRRIAESRIRRMFAGTESLSSDRASSSMRSATVSEVDETESHAEAESDSCDSGTHDSETWLSETSITMTGLTPSPGQMDLPSSSTLLNESPSLLSPQPAVPPMTTGLSDTTPMHTGFQLPRPSDEGESYFPPTLPAESDLLLKPVSDDQASDGEGPDSTNDSDSTISAVPTSLKPLSVLSNAMTGLTPHSEEAASAQSPAEPSPPAPSRIPRKVTRTTSKVATLVQRFQQREGDEQLGDDEEDDQTDLKAYRLSFKSTAMPRQADALTESEQEAEALPRPRLRRGLTDGPSRKKRLPAGRSLSEHGKQREESRLPVSKPWLPWSPVSAGDSHAPSSPEASTGRLDAKSDRLAVSPVASGSQTRKSDEMTSSSSQGPLRSNGRVKPRLAGKSGGLSSPAALARQRGNSGNTRVSTITRHFDRLSREAERDRQKRLSLARGRRARPVTVAKAVVTSLDLRDAVKDESDGSVSSEADDEEDDARSPFKAQPGKRPRHTSPSSPTISPLLPKKDMPITHPLQGPDGIGDLPSSLSTTPSFDVGRPLDVKLALTPPKALQDSVKLDLGPFAKIAPLASVPPTPLLTGGSSSTSQSGGGRTGGGGGGHISESEMSSAGPERNSILKTLSSLWAFSDADLSPLEYPLNASLHLFEGSRIIMREEEPLSIIAFALDSPTYREKLKATRVITSTLSPQSSTRSTDQKADASQDWTLIGHNDAKEHEDSAFDGEGNHLQYAISAGGTAFFCRLLFLERFDNLRTRCGLAGADGFIESLARCVNWESSGGKSKSAFLKTKDDRFVAKELSRQEMDDFSRFAPAYFTYMADCLDNDRPTALAKIFGVYKMGYTSSRGALRMNVMVMENLFYDKHFQVIYDLKGNQRGRHIEPSGKAGEVLLDANLEKTLWNHPLYLRDYSKKIFRSALHNDTKFLSEQGVMDYSVVCAVDQHQSEITAGIIDYIRTFTWDKKLESWVKDSAFFPSKGVGEPTIVGPKQYKTRFRASMEKYLTVIPDFWMHPEHLEAPDEALLDNADAVPPPFTEAKPAAS